MTHEFVKSIDINPTAECNLRCTFCWGPDHNIPDGIDTEGWKQIISFFTLHGTTGVVFTGGEPLIRRDLVDLLRHAKLQSMHTTLSTNTLMLDEDRAKEVLPYVDEIGIPLDGSTPENNLQMRIPVNSQAHDRHFLSVMAALPRVRRLAPHVEITVRTVVSRVNQHNIMDIGRVLDTMPENWDRWKLYQFTPVSIGADYEDDHYLPPETFEIIGRQACKTWPQARISVYSSDERIGRYVFLDPAGVVYGVGNDGGYRQLGNFLDMGEAQIAQAVQSLIDPGVNYLHG